MKIAVFENLVPGGGKRTVLEFIRLLSERNEIDFYTLESNFLSYLPTKYTKNIYQYKFCTLFLRKPFGFLNIFLNFLNIIRLDRLYKNIAKTINKNKYDIAFIHPSYYLYIHCPSISHFLKIPNVYYCQEPTRLFYENIPKYTAKMPKKIKIYKFFLNPFYILFDKFFKFYDYLNIRGCHFVLCNSLYSQMNIKKAYGIEARIHYLGVDINRFKPLNINKENLVISVGHLEPRKGHDFLIYVIGKIDLSIRPTFAIVSPCDCTDYRIYLEKIAKNMNVKLDFFINISDEELVSLYNKAKLTLCAFIKEPFGLVPLESMACGTPVVAVKEAGLKESIIHNKTGLLVERDVDKFSKSIEYLLKHDEIREQMSKNARQYALDKWRWDFSLNELNNIFLKLINNERSRKS